MSDHNSGSDGPLLVLSFSLYVLKQSFRALKFWSNSFSCLYYICSWVSDLLLAQHICYLNCHPGLNKFLPISVTVLVFIFTLSLVLFLFSPSSFSIFNQSPVLVYPSFTVSNFILRRFELRHANDWWTYFHSVIKPFVKGLIKLFLSNETCYCVAGHKALHTRSTQHIFAELFEFTLTTDC